MEKAHMAGIKERLLVLIDEYFDIGFDEGVEGRDHDTVDGKAQKTRSEIDALIAALASTSNNGPTVWRCEECGCHSYAHIDEMKSDGKFSPGPKVRCVECKKVHLTIKAEKFTIVTEMAELASKLLSRAVFEDDGDRITANIVRRTFERELRHASDIGMSISREAMP